ncbi:zinc-binding dehydrogenase [Ramlibacter sp.]|uniref:zinc-binding dehydrogenase n=1 Tax=Ramlibacter sp. TaxID=1917967 RepID=UPI00262553C3|nr:zinc-binding dehydrogenase [Ramlibacter sp.]MDB5954109.1 Alcohol dehydrogenase GroES domain protein [Ramlibacter sp.]
MVAARAVHMQGLGGVRAERPGAYAEFVTVDSQALALVPAAVDPFAMAALGLVGVTAMGGLRQLGSLQGKRVLVTGAAGGVGSAAIAVARAMGASVAGIVARAEQAPHVTGLGADEVIVVERYGADKHQGTMLAWQLIRPIALTGYSTETLDGAGLRASVQSLSTWLETGAIRPPQFRRIPLDRAAEAHGLLEQGGVSGRVLLVPQGKR